MRSNARQTAPGKLGGLRGPCRHLFVLSASVAAIVCTEAAPWSKTDRGDH